mgnify:CR=1 FL=1
MRYSKEYKLECIRKYKNGEHIQDPGGCTQDILHNGQCCIPGATHGGDGNHLPGGKGHDRQLTKR